MSWYDRPARGREGGGFEPCLLPVPADAEPPPRGLGRLLDAEVEHLADLARIRLVEPAAEAA